jgi:hypothetical protein
MQQAEGDPVEQQQGGQEQGGKTAGTLAHRNEA